jgi:hypothetical protein
LNDYICAMKIFLKNPLFAGLLLFVILVTVSFVVSIPLADAVCYYDQNLVHFKVEQSISLRHLLGWDMQDLVKNGLKPSKIELKPVGWAMFVLFYIGFPLLTFLRFRFAAKKMELENGEKVNS